MSIFLKDYYTPISKGALPLLCVFYEIMTFITGKQCSLAPAVKSFLPLFNLDLPHHNKLSKQLFVWELLYCLRYTWVFKRLTEQFIEEKNTKCSHFFSFLKHHKYDEIQPPQDTCFNQLNPMQSIGFPVGQLGGHTCHITVLLKIWKCTVALVDTFSTQYPNKYNSFKLVKCNIWKQSIKTQYIFKQTK